VIGKSIANRPYMYLPLKGDTNDYGTGGNNPSNTGVATTTGQFSESNGAYNWADATDRLSWASSVGNTIATKINAGATFYSFGNVVNTGSVMVKDWFSQYNSVSGQRSFLNAYLNVTSVDDNYFQPGTHGDNNANSSSFNALNSVNYSTWSMYCLRYTDEGSTLKGEMLTDAVVKGSLTSMVKVKENSTLELRLGARTNNTNGNMNSHHTFRFYDVVLSNGALKILNNEKGRIRA